MLKAIEDTYVDFENYSEENENSQDNSREGTSYSNSSRQTNNSRNSSTEGNSRINDTPQNRDSGGYGNEDYASQIEYASSNDNESNEGEENSQLVNADTEKGKITNKGANTHNRNLYHVASHDRDTLIERLNQIDTYYTNVLKKWVIEFEPLIWEVANYEEY